MLLGVKLIVNILSTTALLVFLYPPAWMFAGRQGRWDVWQGEGLLGSRSMQALAWGVGLLSWGLFCSLLFRRVLTCLIVATVATAITPFVVTLFMDLVTVKQTHSDSIEWTLRLAVIPGLLLLASAWFVQAWDENRWPRFVERLLEFERQLSRLRLRATSWTAAPEIGSQVSAVGMIRAILRRVGLCSPDAWLPAWRRETRRLLWLEWRAAWKVALGLVVAGSAVLMALVLSSGSQSDLRFAMSILPLVLAIVVFVLGVWSFHGEQREQRFRFFAAHGASPVAMWVVKHVVWLSCAIMAVVVLLGVSAMVSERAILLKEVMESEMRNVVEAIRDHRQGWLEQEHVEPVIRFVFCLSNATKTSLDEVFEAGELVGQWPLASLVVLSLGRGLAAVWLCFAVGQLVSLLIPRAVTSMLVGLLALGMTVAWWFVISVWKVPLIIAVLPVLIGLLAAAWGRMSDWLEERSGWRRWFRVAATALLPMLVAFVGIATYRVYEVPFVELPWSPVGPASAEARQTGEDWVRLSERLESPWESPDAPKNSIGGDFFSVLDEDLNRIKDAHWRGFAEREWLANNSALLEEALLLANRPDCFMPKSYETFDERKRKQFGRVALLLKMAAFESLANHRLDEALQRALALYHFGQHLGHSHNGRDQWYRGLDVQLAALHVLREWAISPDQTRESLLAALGRSDRGTTHPLAQLVRAEARFVVDPLEALRSEYANSFAMHELRWREGAAPPRWASWEKWRELRLFHVLAAEGADNINRGLTIRPWPNHYGFNAAYDRLLKNREEDRFDNSRLPMSRGQRWQQTTGVSLGWGWSPYEVSNFFLPMYATLETHRRGLWLTLALQAYRQQHGKLPERLEELVGPFLDRLPSDPISGQAFEYRPVGFPLEISGDGRLLAPKTPLLTAPGNQGARREPITNDYRRRYGLYMDESQINGDVNWVSVYANPFANGLPFSAPFHHSGETFSLAPSF